ANIYHYYSGKDVLLFDILDTDLKALRDRIYNVDVIGLLPKETLYAVVLET
ncbi:MAG TPA: TetR family transcriptional regulator, partial [Rhodobacteraceae bacterium]|nr:TetR family transcriptional regulator [Paracoccaceae bacterium]